MRRGFEALFRSSPAVNKVAVGNVIARPADQRIRPQTADDHVITRAAIEHVFTRRIGLANTDIVGLGIGVAHKAISTDSALYARQQVVLGEIARRRPATNHRNNPVTHNEIVAVVAVQGVSALPACDEVVAGATFQHVVAVKPGKIVNTGKPKDQVVVRAAVEKILPGTCPDGVGCDGGNGWRIHAELDAKFTFRPAFNQHIAVAPVDEQPGFAIDDALGVGDAVDLVDPGVGAKL